MDFDEFSWILTNCRKYRVISRLSINDEPGAVRERVKKIRDVFVAKSYAEMCIFVPFLHIFCEFCLFFRVRGPGVRAAAAAGGDPPALENELGTTNFHFVD